MCAKSSNFAVDFTSLKKEVTMRKIGMVAAMLVCVGLTMASEYNFLVFTNTGGTTTALNVSNLSATVSGSTIVVTNDEKSVNFELTELVSMKFVKDTAAALENVLDGDQPVQVYGLNGMELGAFGSLLEAVQQLDKGTYVIVQSGKSQKLIVK